MPRPRPLPAPLASHPFTRAKALALGVTDKRLRSSDVLRLGHGLYRPYRQGDRVDGLDTPAGLAAAVARARKTPGVRRAHRAVDRARVGADSPPETRVRIALVDAGLPEPELQVRGDPADRWSPAADLGYRELKIAIQYDGKHHRSREQQAADAYRDEWFQRHGWLVVRLTWADQAQDFVRLIRLVRERLGPGTGF